MSIQSTQRCLHGWRTKSIREEVTFDWLTMTTGDGVMENGADRKKVGLPVDSVVECSQKSLLISRELLECDPNS